MATTKQNQAKAPVCAAFVSQMRECFPDLKVIHVAEGDVLLGERVPAGAPCIHAGNGQKLAEKYRDPS